MGNAVQKICCLCGQDVGQRRRTKDAAGSYYCDACWATKTKPILSEARSARPGKFQPAIAQSRAAPAQSTVVAPPVPAEAVQHTQQASSAPSPIPAASHQSLYQCSRCSGQFVLEKVFDVAGQIVCTSCYTSEVKAAQAEEESANTRYAPSEEQQTGDAPTSQSIATKGCPFCGEQIKAKAIKCRFCGEMLDTPTGDETGGYAPTTVGRPNGRQRRNDTGQIPQCVLRRESQRCLSVFCIFMMNLVFGLFYAVTLGDHHPSKSLSIWDGVIMGMGVLVIVSGVYSMVWLPSHWRVIMRLPLHRRLLGLIGGFGLILVVVVGILFLPFGQWGLILVGLAFVVRWLLRVSREVH